MARLVPLVERDVQAVLREPAGEGGAEDPGAGDGGGPLTQRESFDAAVRDPPPGELAGVRAQDQVRTPLPEPDVLQVGSGRLRLALRV